MCWKVRGQCVLRNMVSYLMIFTLAATTSLSIGQEGLFGEGQLQPFFLQMEKQQNISETGKN